VSQVIDPISQEQIAAYIRSVDSPQTTHTVVTLIDGETLVGNCGGWGASSPSAGAPAFPGDRNTWQYMTDSELILSNTDLYSQLRCYVPLQDVGGIATIDIEQPIFRSQSWRSDEQADASYARLRERYLSTLPTDQHDARLAIRERQSSELRALFEKELREPKPIDLSALSVDKVEDEFDSPMGIARDELRGFDSAVRARSLMDLLRITFVRRTAGHGYRLERWPVGLAYMIESTVTFAGDFEPKPGEPLYADMEYVAQNREGLTGAGLGFIASATLNWQTSDDRAARRLARQKPTDVATLCDERNTALIRGYVTFLEMPGSSVAASTVSTDNTLSMDGARWRAALISREPLIGPPAEGVPWALSYWREGSDRVPLEMLDRSVPPLEIFGTVQSSLRATPSFGGEASCFLKVRYAQAASTK
jgi:hypothetical protein